MSRQSSYTQVVGSAPPSFDELVREHYGGLYRFAMSLTRSENDASDLVQETYLTWAEKGHQLHQHTKAKSWLFTTLHRLFLQSQRRSTRFPYVEVSEAEAEMPSLPAEVVNSADAATLLDVLSRVDPQYQAAVALFYLEDCSYEEISTILDVPLGTVKSRISRGIAQLKVLFHRESGGKGGGMA